MIRTCTAAQTAPSTPLTGRQTLNALLSASQDEFHSGLQHAWNHVIAQQTMNTTATDYEPVVCTYRFAESEPARD